MTFIRVQELPRQSVLSPPPPPALAQTANKAPLIPRFSALGSRKSAHLSKRKIASPERVRCPGSGGRFTEATQRSIWAPRNSPKTESCQRHGCCTFRLVWPVSAFAAKFTWNATSPPFCWRWRYSFCVSRAGPKISLLWTGGITRAVNLRLPDVGGGRYLES